MNTNSDSNEIMPLPEPDFEKSIQNMDQHYSEPKFLDKLKRTGGKMAKKALHAGLVLYYALNSPAMPRKSRLVILGALGYFIFPLDVIPDFIPGIGLGDDAAILIAALGKLYESVNDETKEKARQKMTDWFGDWE
ncbi:MAG TPA: YkvA family protein [Bacillaceae bacterium]